jgi:hypothetical protein
MHTNASDQKNNNFQLQELLQKLLAAEEKTISISTTLSRSKSSSKKS